MIGASKGSSTIATERTPGEGAPGLEGARSQKTCSTVSSLCWRALLLLRTPYSAWVCRP